MTSSTAALACGWCGTIKALLTVSESAWLASLAEHHALATRQRPRTSQVDRWRSTFRLLRKHLVGLLPTRPDARGWQLVFEYELSDGPGVLLLVGDTVFVLDVTEHDTPLRASVDRVAATTRTLERCHVESRGRRIIPVLTPAAFERESAAIDGVHVAAAAGLAPLLLSLAPPADAAQLDLDRWLASDHFPRPSLIGAARAMFSGDQLPEDDAGTCVRGVLAELNQIVEAARVAGERHLVLIRGVPGSGKTLAGLELVLAQRTTYTGNPDEAAVFLAGSGAALAVLRYVASGTPVEKEHLVLWPQTFLREHGGPDQPPSLAHVWVYDDAQRAWDQERATEKLQSAGSVPTQLLRAAERAPGWSVLVAMIGEGQSVHVGEEGGMALWGEAVSGAQPKWNVHCAPELARSFGETQAMTTAALDLNRSLRSAPAEGAVEWVEQLLDGRIVECAATAARLREQGFALYVTQELEEAKGYARERYVDDPVKRYGLLASSRAKNLAAHGVSNDWQSTKGMREGPWFVDSPDSTASACRLEIVATEFACQGLELDLPIICWGDDLRWHGGTWESPPQRRSGARDPHRLRVNSYRVLLTRGRDGLCVFVPLEETQTFAVLREAGMAPLS
ncbi:MAG: hypothetical protein AVDCRST_MAG77-973 [uncultured Chloroflexi bacterium]|uniref:Schlafen group 3-like DNA/RNA helicase domain-containing protein n=1 Tax=uncultured Chloroflexota bacterium TaxID=166587 RepID=A0A6J4HJ26_9CHLR|nr:MAG: hypothetical protein AVDCRST_MAG77-973 [uncultured Chloroflexota bacterium]